jgi:hypothetical protein
MAGILKQPQNLTPTETDARALWMAGERVECLRLLTGAGYTYAGRIDFLRNHIGMDLTWAVQFVQTLSPAMVEA